MPDPDDFASWYPTYVMIRKKALLSKDTYQLAYMGIMEEYHKKFKFLKADFGVEKYDHWYYYYVISRNALLSCAKISDGNLELTNDGSLTDQEVKNYSWAVNHRTNLYSILMVDFEQLFKI